MHIAREEFTNDNKEVGDFLCFYENGQLLFKDGPHTKEHIITTNYDNVNYVAYPITEQDPEGGIFIEYKSLKKRLYE